MVTINSQYEKYMAMAERYRKNNRPELAAALERQAQRELEKPAMDIADVANIQNVPQNYNGGYINANGWNAPQQAPQQAPQPVQQVVQQPVQQVAPVQQPAQQTTTPNVAPNVDPNVNKVTHPAKLVPYKPTEEELANMADSEQYANNIGFGNGSANPYLDRIDNYNTVKYNPSSSVLYDKNDAITYPGMDNEGDIIASAKQYGKQPVGYQGEGDSLDSPTVDKDEKNRKIKDLAKQAKFAKLYPEYYEINKKDFY